MEQQLVFGFDKEKGQFYLDRTRAGKNEFSSEFAKKYLTDRMINNRNMNLVIYVDVSSIEVFADGGTTVITALFFSR